MVKREGGFLKGLWTRAAAASVGLLLLGSAVSVVSPVTASAKTQLKVGLVTDTGGLNDHGFNHLSYLGLLQAEKVLHIHGSVVQSQQQSDYVPNLTHFAQAGYNLVIAVGFLMDGAVKQVSKEYPHTHFAIIDDPISNEKNVASAIFETQQCGYLVGVLAGLVEKDHALPHLGNTNTFGTVGGISIPPVNTYIAGYIQGIKRVDPTAKILLGYTGNFNDEAAGEEMAQSQHAAGANIIFQVAGGTGLGVITAAKKDNFYAIGVDANQNYLAPHHVITSAEKGVKQAVFQIIKNLDTNHWKSGILYFNLADGGVGYGKPISAIPAKIVREVAKIRKEIIQGKIKISPNIPKKY